jgi:NMT1/THI5 like
MRLAQIRILSLAMLVIFFGIVVRSGVLDAQTQKIRIAYSSRSNTITPLYAAASRGFFREDGLEVELIQVSPRLGAMAVMNADVSFTTSFVSTFRGILQGLPLKVILIALKKGMYFLVVRPEIKDVQDLKQKARSGDDTRNRPTRRRGTTALEGIRSGSNATARHRRNAVESTSPCIRSSSGCVGIAALRPHAATDGLQNIGGAA